MKYYDRFAKISPVLNPLKCNEHRAKTMAYKYACDTLRQKIARLEKRAEKMTDINRQYLAYEEQRDLEGMLESILELRKRHLGV